MISRPVIFVLALTCLCAVHAEGRGMRIWSYDDLQKAADVVAIAEPAANENNTDQFEWGPQIAQGITTTFQVLCYLKGGNPGEKTIQVRHFVYKNGSPPNGGTMVNFLVGPLDITATLKINGKSEPWDFGKIQPQWLVFLKRTKDGFFTPVSGQVDPIFSFRELHDAAMFDPTHGMIHWEV